MSNDAYEGADGYGVPGAPDTNEHHEDSTIADLMRADTDSLPDDQVSSAGPDGQSTTGAAG